MALKSIKKEKRYLLKVREKMKLGFTIERRKNGERKIKRDGYSDIPISFKHLRGRLVKLRVLLV